MGTLLSGAGFGSVEFAQADEPILAYASPGGVTIPGAAWLVTAQAV